MNLITINGVDYPCRQTMGAMLRYKRETGTEVTEIGGGDFSSLAVYLWCCCASACAADKVEFAYTVMDFADNLTAEALAAWAQSIAEGGEDATGAKKNLG